MIEERDKIMFLHFVLFRGAELYNNKENIISLNNQTYSLSLRLAAHI